MISPQGNLKPQLSTHLIFSALKQVLIADDLVGFFAGSSLVSAHIFLGMCFYVHLHRSKCDSSSRDNNSRSKWLQEWIKDLSTRGVGVNLTPPTQGCFNAGLESMPLSQHQRANVCVYWDADLLWNVSVSNLVLGKTSGNLAVHIQHKLAI